MVRQQRLWALLPRPIRRFPPDLAAVVGLVAASAFAIFLPGVRDSVLRAVLGAAFVLVAPGYAITAALFPEAGDPEPADDPEQSDDRSTRDAPTTLGFLSRPREGITLLERAVFSVGLSAAVVPLLVLVLNFAPWGIGFASLAVSVGALTVGAVAVATVRRWRVPADERFRVPADEWAAAVRSELFEPTSRADAAMNAALVAAVLVAAGGGAYAVLGPQQGQSFTEFYVLGENETGDLVADDYPDTLERGENATVVVGVANHEPRATEYTVVVQLQRVAVEGNSSTVTESRRVDRFRTRVGVNETVHRRHVVQPGMTGERLRLQYLLYADDPPADPSAGNAYRSVHVWLNVTDA